MKFSPALVQKTWDNYWFRPASKEPLLFYRFLIFVIGPLYIFLIPTHQPPSFFDHWQPISFYNILSEPVGPTVLSVIKFLWIGTSLAAGFNLYFAFTAKIAAFSAVFYLGYNYNFGHVYHGTHLYVMVLAILSFSQIDRTSTMSSRHRWPIAFCMAYISYVMFFCGMQKLYYGDGLRWVFSESFYLRLLTNPYSTDLNRSIVQAPIWVSKAMAFWGIIITEVCTPLYLFRKNTRYLAFIIWTGFHISVMLAFGSHKSFVTQVLCYFAILPMEDWISAITPLTRLLHRSTGAIPRTQ